jgi:chemotaxis regulatin CheY-phosphate phosphatase CheZ
MKKLFWLAMGVWIGSVGLKKARENEKYAEIIERAGDLTKELREALTDGFRDRESEIRRDRGNADNK